MSLAAPRSRSNRSGAQALGDVWSGPGQGPSIYLYITRCKLICLARKNTFLLPSKRSCFPSAGRRALSGQAREQTFWEYTEVSVRQGCHLQGVSPHWALEPADPDSSPSSVTGGWQLWRVVWLLCASIFSPGRWG